MRTTCLQIRNTKNDINYPAKQALQRRSITKMQFVSSSKILIRECRSFRVEDPTLSVERKWKTTFGDYRPDVETSFTPASHLKTLKQALRSLPTNDLGHVCMRHRADAVRCCRPL